MELGLERRASSLKAIVACGLLAGTALSPKLWIASRVYPLTPVFAHLPEIGGPWDVALATVFAVSIILAAVAARPLAPILAAVGCAAVLACLDQSRLQPWFYQYTLTLAALAWFYSSPDPTRRASALNACRLLLASVYFWSGVQKLNPHFAPEVVTWIAKPLLQSHPALSPILQPLGLAAPFVEIAIGLGLLYRRTRTAAMAAAIAMHCGLLIALGPFGRNSNAVVWPWNLVMIGCVIVLFRNTPQIPARAIALPAGPALWRVAVLFIALSPALSLFGLWDHYLSWALYSGNKDDAAFYVSDALFDKLPAEAQDHVYEYKPDMSRLDIADWSWDELHVPAYPELRVYRRIAQWICRYAAQPADLKIEIRPKLLWWGNPQPVVLWDCSTRF